MNNKTPINALLIAAACLFGFSWTPGHGIEPTSTVSPSTDQYALCNDPNGNITFTTSDKPTPDCTGDLADGDPVYFWDYGTLDGDTSTPGTLKIKTDVEGDYSISVYCVQQFKDSQGNDYTVQTMPSQ